MFDILQIYGQFKPISLLIGYVFVFDLSTIELLETLKCNRACMRYILLLPWFIPKRKFSSILSFLVLGILKLYLGFSTQR